MSDRRTVEAAAFLVVSPGTRDERSMPIHDRIFVGRECAGIDPEHQVLIDDLTASRLHFEIRLDAARNAAFIVDMSTNGTYVNGSRLARALAQPLRPGDWVTVGGTEFEFRSDLFFGIGAESNSQATRAEVGMATMMMVVGDITNFSTISQVTDSEVLAASLRTLYAELITDLQACRGTLSYYAGDALYAVWDTRHIPTANELAIDFALAADRRVQEVAPGLPLRGPGGDPVQMGWGVVHGLAAVVTLPQSAVSVVGDTTNLAFRLSGIAGREGRARVLVADAAHTGVAELFRWGASDQVPTKGRSGMETVHPALGRS